MPAIREFLQANARLDSAIAQVVSSREVIRVSAFASMAMHWLPSIIRRFREERPDVDVDIRHGGSCQQLPTSCWRRERWTLSSSAARKRRAAMWIQPAR